MQQERIGKERGTQYQNLLALLGKYQGVTESSVPFLKATQMRSVVNSHRLAEAYKKDSKVAYVSEQFPTEIVFAFDAIPWNIESMANMLAQSVDMDRIFQVTQERALSRDICSLLRGPRGMMLENCYPTPNIVLMNNQPCEGLSKIGFNFGKNYETPFLALHAPGTLDEDARTYIVKQMNHMISRMEEAFGVGLDLDVLRSVTEHANRATEYYRKAAELIQTRRVPYVSRELHEIFGMNYFGSKANAQVCKTLYEEALTLPEESKKRRVLWLGQVPAEDHETIQHMNQVVDIIYWAPLWKANMMLLDNDDPLRSIAERAILYHWDSERMCVETSEICDAYEIEGLVIASMWGCRNMMGISPMLRNLATSKKLKHLVINVDVVDRNNYSFEQVKNRLDAFLELMQ